MALCKLLGIEKPIIQAPMAGVQNWELAVAVSEAGGLGSIPCGMLSNEQIETEIQQFIAHSTKPYNLNFFCHTMPDIDHQALQHWEYTLQKHFQRLSVNPPTEVAGLRVPFDNHIADIIEPYQPPVVSFHFGLPSPTLIKRIKSWGTVILSSATTVEEGIWLQENGADAVIAQGIEAGGHRAMFMTSDPDTQRSTMTLLNDLLQVLSVPVIAAGGIATGKNVQEALHQGAAGVQMGTTYLLCHEAKTSKVHRKALASKDQPTELTNVFSGRLARGIKNLLMEDQGFISSAAPPFPYASLAISPLRQKAESQGSSDYSPLWAGTNQTGCQEVSAKVITEELCRVVF
ncbi:nitronate monooxygenase [uncultured Endozoicomonas sp.]|uniref:NAD(P)H-dependent flavin oxidoreductase n=1 Tax=uncultured Endozoicomonas sp. TaxID=432652 RepID=UPI00261EC14C|nr:nitronate monooxygenase [uncultured Endozoicomonas sp.]